VASFNFKSSGNRVSDREVNPKITKKERDIGFKTPLTNYQRRQIFDMHTDPAAQLKDNLKNLILTNAGERLGLYDFGADLNALLFDLSSDRNVEAEFVDRINIAVQKYMPGIEIDEVTEVELDRNEKEIANRAGMAKIRLRIRFSIPAARIANQAIEVTLQAGG
jgi:phage baseplate assembly protein W